MSVTRPRLERPGSGVPVPFDSSLRAPHRHPAARSGSSPPPPLPMGYGSLPHHHYCCEGLLTPPAPARTAPPASVTLPPPSQWPVTWSPDTLDHTRKIFQALFPSTFQPFSGQLPPTPKSTQACLVAGAARRFFSAGRENCEKDREGKWMLPGIPSATAALPRRSLSLS